MRRTSAAKSASHDMLDRPADTLTVAGRKRLELARALATEPKLLLLDEVLAGLNPSEIRDIVPVIRGLCERGISILMIEHVMQAVMQPVGACLRAGGGQHHRRRHAGAGRRRSKTWSRPISVTARRRSSEPRMPS